jgi:hypothetical protein
MARIDFDTRNIGKNIADDAEFELPAHVHAATGQTLSLPQRYGINKGENPPIIFDRYPGWTDTDAKTELERLWTDDEWPSRIVQFLSAVASVQEEANYRMSESSWRMEKAMEVAEGDYTEAGLVAELAKKADCRAKSNAREAEIKVALLAKKHPDYWPDTKIWDCALGEYSGQGEISKLHGPGATKENLAKRVEDDFGVTDPGSGL